MTGDVRVRIDDLTAFARAALESGGAKPEQAALCADVIVEQDLRGHGHHGSQILALRVRELMERTCDPNAVIETLADLPGLVALDAHNAMGPVASVHAMDLCIDRAQKLGIGMVTVRNLMHWVIPAYYAMRAAAQGLIGYCACVTSPSFAPVGGNARVLGNNPFAYAIPADPRPPVVADFGVSASSGRMNVAARRGESIPADWAMDKDGKPITDPKRAMAEGIFLPAAGHKGYALGLVIELMCSMMNGLQIGLLRKERGMPGTVFMAWRIDAVMPKDEFLREVNLALDAVTATSRIDPKVPVMYPGERSGYELLRNRERGVVDLPQTTWMVLTDVAKTTSVSLPATVTA